MFPNLALLKGFLRGLENTFFKVRQVSSLKNSNQDCFAKEFITLKHEETPLLGDSNSSYILVQCHWFGLFSSPLYCRISQIRCEKFYKRGDLSWLISIFGLLGSKYQLYVARREVDNSRVTLPRERHSAYLNLCRLLNSFVLP